MKQAFLKIFVISHFIYLFLLFSSAEAENASPGMESGLLTIIELIENNQIDRATEKSLQLKQNYPGSRAGQLLYADLQAANALAAVAVDSKKYYSRQLLELLNEIKVRKQHAALTIKSGFIPDNIILPASDTRHIIAIDLSRSRLYLLQRDSTSEKFILRENHYVSVGLGGIGKEKEGDLKTPIGIYHINSFKPDETLPTLYGTGAFTLDFPNPLDRHLGIDGSGIWLHGVPHGQLSRPPHASEGCVVMQNQLITDLLALTNLDNTPVILAEQLTWSGPQKMATLRESLLQQIKTTEHHPLKVSSKLNKSVPRWIKTKYESDLSPPSIQSDALIESLEIYAYPPNTRQNHNQPLYQVRFLQPSDADSEQNTQAITQYWSKNSSGTWALMLNVN